MKTAVERPSRVNASNGNPFMLMHRCYKLSPLRKGWKGTLLFNWVYEQWPSSFFWTNKNDIDGVKKYIDLLLTDHIAEAKFYEANGLVEDVQYIDPNERVSLEKNFVHVNIHRMLDLFKLRDSFRVPIWHKLHFVTDQNRLVPVEFIAALSEFTGEDEDMGGDWKKAKKEDLSEMGLAIEDVHTGMYREDSASVEAGRGEEAAEEGDDPDRPPDETEVSRKTFDRHFELVSRITRGGARPYFCRRLIRYDGHVLWSGTAWDAQGPWRTHERDNAQLLALGVVP